MPTQTIIGPKTTYRNFNLCQHCLNEGQEPLLHRLCEGMPMISRSDGKTFHLLLADRPLPYPLERAGGPSERVTVCFWYSHVQQKSRSDCTIVILPGRKLNHPSLFRKIEMVADLLAEELSARKRLAEVYELFEEPKAEWTAPEFTAIGSVRELEEEGWLRT